MRHCGTVPFKANTFLNTCAVTQPSLCAELHFLSGIELNEERGINGDSDFTIRGRLMSLVEKVAYLKKRMANLPKEKADKKPSKSFIRFLF